MPTNDSKEHELMNYYYAQGVSDYEKGVDQWLQLVTSADMRGQYRAGWLDAEAAAGLKGFGRASSHEQGALK